MKFFIEHDAAKKYPKGGFAARIKKGYLSESNDDPKFAVKIYHQKMYGDNTVHEVRLAMRAAYCYKQLGRESICFRRNNKQYMVTEWLSGVNLHVANQKQVQSMPIPQRIIMAISLLRELSILHRQGLLHHDIKPGNVMINFGKLGFVDLDSVTIKNKPPVDGMTLMYTERYLPSAQMSFDAVHNPRQLYSHFNEKTDIYQMGLTLAHLFQEVYVPKEVDNEIKVNGDSSIKSFLCKSMTLLHGPEYDKHPDLQKLIKQMFLQESPSPLTADECIEAFKKVLSTYPDHEKYLEEDRLVDLGKDLSITDGEKAFKEIEIELLAFNQRLDTVTKLKIS